MKRYLPRENGVHDLVVVGGGIYGASMAYTASLNGIDAVLFEQDDFACHTSANSQKVIHGGIRYLQSFDLKRVVESIKEKHRFYRLFPHQVRPLPCVFATSGYLTQGNEAFRIAFFLYSMLERWFCKSSRKREFSPTILSKEELVQRFPHLQKNEVRGGALWYDGICLEPERVVLSLLKSVVQCGGQVANYMQVVAFHREQDGFFRVKLSDTSTGQSYQVRTRKIAFCTGPWFQERFGEDELPKELQELSLIRGMNLLVPALFSSGTSLATKVKDGLASRFLFVVPWKKFSIEGTYWEDCCSFKSGWSEHKARADAFHQLHQQVLEKGREKIPVLASHVGYVPGLQRGGGDASKRVLSHYLLVDRDKKSPGDVLQVVGVKFTTAFDVVLKALRYLFPDKKTEDVLSFSVLPSGSFAGSLEDVFKKNRTRIAKGITKKQYITLFQLFGEEAGSVIDQYIYPQVGESSTCSQESFYRGIARYCIDQEMVYHLVDLVWRRLFPDHPKPLCDTIVRVLAEEMADGFGWSEEQKQEEILRLQQGRVLS